jgi:hypothetical protein
MSKQLNNLENKTINELIVLCKKRNIKGYSTLSKQDIIKLLKGEPIEKNNKNSSKNKSIDKNSDKYIQSEFIRILNKIDTKLSNKTKLFNPIITEIDMQKYAEICCARIYHKAKDTNHRYGFVNKKYLEFKTFGLGDYINDKYHNDNLISMFGKNKILLLIDELKKIILTTPELLTKEMQNIIISSDKL